MIIFKYPTSHGFNTMKLRARNLSTKPSQQLIEENNLLASQVSTLANSLNIVAAQRDKLLNDNTRSHLA